MNIILKKNKMNYFPIIGRFLSKKKKTLTDLIKEAISYESNALMFYLGSPQKFLKTEIDDKEIKEFKDFLALNKNFLIENIMIHAPYIINLGNKENEKIFKLSINILKEKIELMEKIGLSTIIIHPGSSLLKFSEKETIEKISDAINEILKKTKYVKIALETTCKKGGVIGWKLEHLRDIMDKIIEENKERIGICWDTCHLYSSGYDIKSEKGLEKFIIFFDKIIGLKKLFVIHINDSEGDLGTNIDRHKNIGMGKIGLDSLKKIVLHPKLHDIVKILETPKINFEFNYNEIKKLKTL